MISFITDFLRPRPNLKQAAQMLSEASVEARRVKRRQQVIDHCAKIRASMEARA